MSRRGYGSSSLVVFKRRPEQYKRGPNACVRCLRQFELGEWMVPSGSTAWRHQKPCRRVPRGLGREGTCQRCGGGTYFGIEHVCPTRGRRRKGG